ncbi:MAG: UDP-N-acetylmuramoyl-tripeptide--D-alanyl-D-alanine ligase [Acidobacteriota bacterium]
METAHIITIVLSLVVALVWSIVRCIRSLHLLQLDSYSNARLLKWLWFSPFDRLFDYRLGLSLLAGLGLHFLLWQLDVTYGHFVSPVCWIILGALLFFKRSVPEAKKPFVYTGRAKRILVVAILICSTIGAVFLFFALKGSASAYKPGAVILAGGLLLTQLASLVVLVSNFLLTPVQSSINNGYIRSAKKKLNEISPVVIGVAGSYGKTSTKYFIETLLAERFLVLKTPKSFNTLMGLCRVINDDLKPEHQVFIAEMGAYRRGDVRELAELVSPRIGIITSIGPEHFERFKSMENIKATNYELIDLLPKTGVAVFNNDIDDCRELADRTNSLKVLRYGLDTSHPHLRLSAAEISMSSKGLSFVLVDSEGNRASTHAGLLGRHNVLNILGAGCIALEMGMSLQEIARAIPKIKQVPHRLQLVPGSAGVTVIDDSYNSNPIGAIEALNVLREFSAGKRVLVTPGMVELGVLESEENEKLGAAAAKICDYVLLVGARQTQPILRGLEREKFPRERLRVVKDLAEATSELQKIVQAGDVVLFENDLPDLYAET